MTSPGQKILTGIQTMLLAGGDKSTQDADIKRAIEIAKEWKDSR